MILMARSAAVTHKNDAAAMPMAVGKSIPIHAPITLLRIKR